MQARRHLLTAACLLALVALFAVPLWLDSRRTGPDERFVGTDSAATSAIEQTHPDYQPWFRNLFEPSGEVESGLFALQAAAGAGVLGYAVGYLRGRKNPRPQGSA